jgi:hypothetical protein
MDNEQNKLTALQKLQNYNDGLRAKLDYKQVSTMINLTIGGLVVSLFLFGYLWVNMLILKAIFIAALIILVVLFSVRHFWYEDQAPIEKKVQKTSKSNDKSFDLGDIGLNINNIGAGIEKGLAFNPKDTKVYLNF